METFDINPADGGVILTAKAGTLFLSLEELAGMTVYVAGMLDARAGVGPGDLGPALDAARDLARRLGAEG